MCYESGAVRERETPTMPVREKKAKRKKWERKRKKGKRFFLIHEIRNPPLIYENYRYYLGNNGVMIKKRSFSTIIACIGCCLPHCSFFLSNHHISWSSVTSHYKSGQVIGQLVPVAPLHNQCRWCAAGCHHVLLGRHQQLRIQVKEVGIALPRSSFDQGKNL